MEKLIETILSKIDIPFEYEEYQGNADSYIMYSLPTMSPGGTSDDKIDDEEYFVVVAYWTKELSELKRWIEIKDLLIDNGFEFKRFKSSKDKEYRGRLLEFIYKNEV